MPFRASHVRCMRFEECMRTSFPSSAPSGHPLSPVRPPAGEESRCRRTDRPRPAFRRRPAKDAAIPQTGMPSTVAPARALRRELLHDDSLASIPRSRRPHVFPRLGERCLHGPCKHHGTVTRDPWHSRDKRLCYPLDCSCLGLTTQARQRGSTSAAVAEADCSARTCTGRSASTASTTESPRPDVPRTS
jgi:hypothetical protein